MGIRTRRVNYSGYALRITYYINFTTAYRKNKVFDKVFTEKLCSLNLFFTALKYLFLAVIYCIIMLLWKKNLILI